MSVEFKEVGLDDFKYTLVDYDEEGKAKADKYKPLAFDLVQLFHMTGTYPGWWTGNKWFALRKKKDHKITYWKKINEHRQI